jgi:hypothetical protein
MIPILLFVGFFAAIHAARHSSIASALPRALPSGKGPTATVGAVRHRVTDSRGDGRRVTPVDLVTLLIRGGHVPADWLVDRAIEQAYQEGDMETVETLGSIFSPEDMETSEETDEGEETPVGGSSEAPAGSAASEPQSASSPLDGVGDDDWQSFIEALSVEKEDFGNDRHVGRFYHSRERLKQLGIDDVSNADLQYKALVADVSDSRKQARRLIQDYCGDVVSVKGSEAVITESGILGLIKSAGIKGANDWIKNPSDRDKFPRTTETFLSTNGVF